MVRAQGDDSGGHQAGVAPVGSHIDIIGDAAHLIEIGTDVGGTVHDVPGLLLEGDSAKGHMCPAVAVSLEVSLVIDTVTHPRSHAESDAAGGVATQHLYLRNVGIVEVDGKPFQRTPAALCERHGEHAAMTDKLCAVALQRQVAPSLEADAHSLGLVLVVVRDIHFFGHRVVCIQVVFGTLLQFDYHLV